MLIHYGEKRLVGYNRGGSAVQIPDDVLKRVGLKQGDNVAVLFDVEKQQVIIKKGTKRK